MIFDTRDVAIIRQLARDSGWDESAGGIIDDICRRMEATRIIDRYARSWVFEHPSGTYT